VGSRGVSSAGTAGNRAALAASEDDARMRPTAPITAVEIRAKASGWIASRRPSRPAAAQRCATRRPTPATSPHAAGGAVHRFGLGLTPGHLSFPATQLAGTLAYALPLVRAVATDAARWL
jgi:hypothetical protein